jgi:hypothetical protein
MRDDDNPAQAFLKSKSTETVAPDALDAERNDQWPHAQCAADLFSFLYIFSEGAGRGYDGEEHSATWEGMCWLMDQAVPDGLSHSEAVGPSAFDPERIRVAVIRLTEDAELERLASLLAQEVESLGSLLVATDHITDSSFMQAGLLSEIFDQLMPEIAEPEMLQPSHPRYVGDEQLISYFMTAVERYIEDIESKLQIVIEGLEISALSLIQEAIESHYVYLRKWRDQEVQEFMAPERKEIREQRKAIAEKREADYLVRVERKEKAENQNFLFKVGAVVLLIVVTLLWKEFVG